MLPEHPELRFWLMIVILLINVLIIGPGGFFLKLYLRQTIKFRKQIAKDLDALQVKIYTLKHNISKLYVTKNDFQNYQKEQVEKYRHLDKKIGKRQC